MSKPSHRLLWGSAAGQGEGNQSEMADNTLQSMEAVLRGQDVILVKTKGGIKSLELSLSLSGNGKAQLFSWLRANASA